MKNQPISKWPPELIPWDSDWDKYNEKIFEHYKEYYCSNKKLYFDGMQVKTRRYPIQNGKYGGYWHIIGGNDGIPDRKRCERLLWARVLIEHYELDEVLVWEEPSRHDGSIKDVVFWARELNYYAILAKRNGYWVLRSAYYIEYDSKKVQLDQAYKKYGPYKTRIASKTDDSDPSVYDSVDELSSL